MRKLNFKDATPEIKRHRFNYAVVFFAFVIIFLSIF